MSKPFHTPNTGIDAKAENTSASISSQSETTETAKNEIKATFTPDKNHDAEMESKFGKDPSEQKIVEHFTSQAKFKGKNYQEILLQLEKDENKPMAERLKKKVKGPIKQLNSENAASATDAEIDAYLKDRGFDGKKKITPELPKVEAPKAESPKAEETKHIAIDASQKKVHIEETKIPAAKIEEKKEDVQGGNKEEKSMSSGKEGFIKRAAKGTGKVIARPFKKVGQATIRPFKKSKKNQDKKGVHNTRIGRLVTWPVRKSRDVVSGVTSHTRGTAKGAVKYQREGLERFGRRLKAPFSKNV